MILYEEKDRNILFGDDEKVHEYQSEEVDFLDLLVIGEFFTSKSSASKSGWDKVIPPRYSMYKIGKMKRIMCVYHSCDLGENGFIKNNYKNLLKSM